MKRQLLLVPDVAVAAAERFLALRPAVKVQAKEVVIIADEGAAPAAGGVR